MIAEKVAEFNKIFNTENVWQGEDDWTKNVPIGNLEQWLTQTLQDTIDTVLEGERKQAALIVEEMMEDEEHWKPITNRILDKTLPNKV